MDEKTLKLLQDFAKHARGVAAEIHQPPPPNAMPYGMPKGVDKKLREIEEQLLSVVAAIESYYSTSDLSL